MSFFTRSKTELVAPEQALRGRSEPNFRLPERHRVLDAPLVTDTAPEGYEVARIDVVVRLRRKGR